MLFHDDLKLYIFKKLLVDSKHKIGLSYFLRELSYTASSQQSIFGVLYKLKDIGFIKEIKVFPANNPKSLGIVDKELINKELNIDGSFVPDKPDSGFNRVEITIDLSKDSYLKKEVEEEVELFKDPRKKITGDFFDNNYTLWKYGYLKQKRIVLKEIENLYNQYENKTIHLNFRAFDIATLPLQTLILLEQEEYIVIDSLSNNPIEFEDYAHVRIGLCKKFFAETKAIDPTDFPIDLCCFSPLGDSLYIVCNTEKYKISDFDALGPTDLFLRYLMSLSSDIFTKNDWEVYLKEKWQTTPSGAKFSDLITQLGFSGKVRKAFFPAVHARRVQFRHIFSLSELGSFGINKEDFIKELKNIAETIELKNKNKSALKKAKKN